MDFPNKKALGYVRISSTRQINNESPETQKTIIQEYADRNNIEIIEWFFDEAKSGKNTDREELQNLLKYALHFRGKIDHVIVYKMTRAGRDLESYMVSVKAILNARGITIRSATEPVDETVSGRFMEGLLVLVGQLDNDTKAAYTIDNMRQLALQGYWQHPPMVGYDSHKIPNELGKLRPSMRPNAMAAKVKKVLERFSLGDISKAELTRYATEIGLRNRNGGKMSEDSINRLLNSPEHAGYVHDKFTDYELVDGKHEAIISTETYWKNIHLMKSGVRKGELHLKQNHLYPLKGTALCINCRKPLYASAPKTGSGGSSPRYHCTRKTCRGKSSSIGADKVHDDFIDVLQRIKPTPGLLKLYKTVLVRSSNDQLANINSKIRVIRAELDKAAELRRNTIQKFIEDHITKEEKNSIIDSLDEKKINLSQELKELELQQGIRETDIEYAINFMDSIDKQWQTVPYELKLRFQSMIFPEGVVYDSKERRFGTTLISPLYRYITTEKGSEEPLKSHLVALVQSNWNDIFRELNRWVALTREVTA